MTLVVHGSSGAMRGAGFEPANPYGTATSTHARGAFIAGLDINLPSAIRRIPSSRSPIREPTKDYLARSP